MPVPSELLEIMQCPDCGGRFEELDDPSALACSDCGVRYPVEDDIPVMLPEEAYRIEG